MYWKGDEQVVNFLGTVEVFYSASTNYLNNCLPKYL